MEINDNAVFTINGDFNRAGGTSLGTNSGSLSSYFRGGEMVCYGNYSNYYDTTGTIIKLYSPKPIDITTSRFILSDVNIENNKYLVMDYGEVYDSGTYVRLFVPSGTKVIADSLELKSGGYYAYSRTAFENNGNLTLNNFLSTDYYGDFRITNNAPMTIKENLSLTNSYWRCKIYINGLLDVNGNVDLKNSDAVVAHQLNINSDLNLGQKDCGCSTIKVNDGAILNIGGNMNNDGGYYNGSYHYSSLILNGNATINGNYESTIYSNMEINDNAVFTINGDFNRVGGTSLGTNSGSLSSYFRGGEMVCYGNYNNSYDVYKTKVIFAANKIYDITTPTIKFQNISSNHSLIMYYDANLNEIVLSIPEGCDVKTDSITLNYVYNGSRFAVKNDGELFVNQDMKNASEKSKVSIIQNGNTTVKGDYIDSNYYSKYNAGVLKVYGDYSNKSELNGTVLIHYGGFPIGDVDRNGYVEYADCAIILKSISGAIVLDEQQELLADYNEDGLVNIIDSIEILSNISKQVG